MLRRRMIPSSYCKALGNVVVEGEKVFIVSGESGSGKTFSAIMDCGDYDILYLTPEDIGWGESSGWNSKTENYYASLPSVLTESQRTKRDEAAREAILSAIEHMRFCKPSKVHPFKNARSKRGITLIVDEVGEIPQFVRA
eukprot:PhF_6_TR38481/c0_g1_i1/m.57202